MITCDNSECMIEWFHTKCLQISKVPRGKWYCPDCRKLSKYNKKKAGTLGSLIIICACSMLLITFFFIYFDFMNLHPFCVVFNYLCPNNNIVDEKVYNSISYRCETQKY